MKAALVGASVLAILYTGFACAAPAGSFVDVRRFPPISGDAAAGAERSAACTPCHGTSSPPVAMYPRLAGQPAGYLYLQMKSYREDWRESAIMKPQVARLSDEDMRDLAVYYAQLSPAQAARTSEGDTSRGADLYLNGDPPKGIPPCQGCHGEQGGGPVLAAGTDLRNLTTYPALAGLPAAYLQAQLAAYADGSRSTTTNAKIMVGVARSLDEASMNAIAAHLEQLRPK